MLTLVLTLSISPIMKCVTWKIYLRLLFFAKLILESRLILFTYRKYLEANVAGFLAIYIELKSLFERKTRWKELFSPLWKWNCVLKCLSVDAVWLSSYLAVSTNMRITNIKNEDESPEKLQVFHRIKQTHVKCTARPHGRKNGIFEVQSDFTLHGSICLCSAAWA